MCACDNVKYILKDCLKFCGGGANTSQTFSIRVVATLNRKLGGVGGVGGCGTIISSIDILFYHFQNIDFE